jgi:hypothetical protein
LVAPTAFHGLVTVEVFGAQSTQIYSLQGTASPPRPGAWYVNQLSIRLKGIWGTDGTASYSYIHGGVHEPPHVVDNVPVKVRWLLQE